MNGLRRVIVQIAYFFFNYLPVKNRVVFAGNSQEKLQGNLKFICRELEKSSYTGEIVIFTYQSQNTLSGKAVYILRLIKGAYYLATSRFFIVDDYYYPIYVIKPKEKVTIIQVWHGCGAFKKFGYSVLDKEFGMDKKLANKVKIHSNYDFALVSSTFVVDKYAEAFNMDKDKIISIGIPRTDLFFDHEKIARVKEDFYQKYPGFKSKKVILYAPTFRGSSKFDANCEMLPDFKTMASELGPGYKIIVKLHPYLSAKTLFREGSNDFVVDLSQWEDINELMLISDVLITDYSSVVFEYSLLERPMVFFSPDIESYIRERDFYYDYESFVPGKIAKSTKELTTIIKNEDYHMDRIAEFKNKFFDHQDKNSSQRFVQTLILGRNQVT